jgi:hypothetical protein
LTAIKQEKNAFEDIDLEEQVKKYVADLESKMNQLVKAAPQTAKECHQLFLLKKRVLDTVLAYARIDGNREIHVKFRTDFLNLAGQTK